MSHALRDGVNVQTYRKRAVILIGICEKSNELQKGHIHLDCSSTAYYMFQELFKDYTSLKEHMPCLNCNNQNTREKTTIVINLPKGDFKFFHDVLYNNMYSEENHKCDICGIFTVKCNYTFNNHIFIELFAAHDELLASKSSNVSLVLSDIPKRLLSNEKFFHFKRCYKFHTTNI